jgi:Leucine-rich repeat (LRR) protein
MAATAASSSPAVRMNGSLTLATPPRSLSSSLNGALPGDGYVNLMSLPGVDRLITLQREFDEQMGAIQKGLSEDAEKVAQTTTLFFSNSQNSPLLCLLLSQFPNLTNLVFENDAMVTFPKNVELRKLTSFSITRSPTFSVASICHLSTLTVLDLTENRLEALPPEVGLLTLLKILRCAKNLLEALPAELVQCKELEELDISSTKISDIPGPIYKLPKLKTIDARSNGLGPKPKGEDVTEGERKITIPGKAEPVILLYSPHLRSVKKKDPPPQGATAATPPPKSAPTSPLLSLGAQTLASKQPNGLSTNSAVSPLEAPRIMTAPVPQSDPPSPPKASPEPAPASDPPPMRAPDYTGSQVLINSYLPTEWEKLKTAVHLEKVIFYHYKLDASRLKEVSLPRLTTLQWFGGTLSDVTLVCHFTALQTLTLQSLSLSSLPPEVAQLSELTEVKLAQNTFSSFPQVLLQLPKLEKIGFENNRFSSFPTEALESPSLRMLNLQSNSLLNKKTLPEGEKVGENEGVRKVHKRNEGNLLVFY